jgi:uracil-DNA glycosylase
MTFTLDDLNNKIKSCVACNLHVNRKCVVLGEGLLSPKVMFVGEAPGKSEEDLGRPFVGRAGQKLNEMITWLGLQRSEVYISNSNHCRPPQNRVPTIEEILACRGYLLEEVRIVDPQLIVLLGRTALNSLLGAETKKPLRDYMTDFLLVNIGNKSYTTSIVAHPSFHLYNSEKAWSMTKDNWLRIKNYVASL